MGHIMGNVIWHGIMVIMIILIIYDNFDLNDYGNYDDDVDFDDD